MKIRIQNSNNFIDMKVEHAYLLSNPDIYENEFKPKIQNIIDSDNLKCDGCGKPLKENKWICVNHRPKSAGIEIKKINCDIENEKTGERYVAGEFDIENKWAIFLFCFDTRESCLKKWSRKRPK